LCVLPADKQAKLGAYITGFVMHNGGVRRIILFRSIIRRTFALFNNKKQFRTMEEQILIFRTSIKSSLDIKHIAALFTLCPQINKWNVDLEDWEKILRIECQGITSTEISKALRAINIFARELE